MAGRVHTFRAIRPSYHEACQWRDFALMARGCALGECHDWARLKALALQARGLSVFGQAGDGNVCRLLIDAAVEACEAGHPDLVALYRCADAVMAVHTTWSMVHQAERRRG